MLTTHSILQQNSAESILVKWCMHTHGRILRYTKYRLWTRKIKMIGQKKAGRNAPCKWFKLPREHDSLTESTRVSSHTYSTFFPPKKHFTCFTTFPLCGNFFFVQSWKASALSLTTGLAANIWCSPHHHPSLISGREPKTYFKLLQAEATEISPHWSLNIFVQDSGASFPQSAPRCSVSSWGNHCSCQWWSPTHPVPGGSRRWKTRTLSLVSLSGWAKWRNTLAVKFLQKEWIQIFMVQFFLE